MKKLLFGLGLGVGLGAAAGILYGKEIVACLKVCKDKAKELCPDKCCCGDDCKCGCKEEKEDCCCDNEACSVEVE